MLYMLCDQSDHCFISIKQIGLGSIRRYKEIMGDLNSLVEKSHLLCVGCGPCMQELHIVQNILDYGNPWNSVGHDPRSDV